MKNSLSLSKTRNSSIELLRILAMLFVVLSHYSVHGQLQIADVSLTFNKLLLNLAKTGGLGVDIFVIISSYFLVSSSLKLKKILKLIFQVFFYSVIIYLLCVISGLQTFEVKEFIRCLLPSTTNQYWFFTVYLVLYLIHPFLNKFIENIKQKQHFIVIIFCVFIWSIVPTFLDEYNFYGNELALFVMLYFLGSYIRLYPLNAKKEKTLGILLIIIGTLTSLMFMALVRLLPFLNINHLGNTSIFVIFIAVGLFMIFKNLNIGTSSVVNNIAMCTFGVYLIHDNNYIRTLLWNNLLPNEAYKDSPYLILHMIACVLIVYVVCTIIEYLRIHLFEAPLFKILDKPIEKFNKLIRETFNRLYNKFDNIFYKSQN